jgi:hypothetical protein
MQQRLPKTRRVPEAVASKKLTERSLAIIETIARYRFLLARDIVRLVGGNEDVTHRHLQQLYHRDLINRFTLPAPRTGEFIYFLDNAAGLRQLADASSLQGDLLDREGIRTNREKYGENATRSVGRFLFIEHELMISRFHANLETSARADGGVEIKRWLQDASLWNNVRVAPKRTLPHRPDALFTLYFPNAPEGQKHANFLYEADRETSSLIRIREKLEAHVQFFLQGKHIEAYGFRKLRGILVETLSEDRSLQLRGLATDLAAQLPLARMLFWFSCTTPTDSAQSIHARRWSCASDDRLRSLVD